MSFAWWHVAVALIPMLPTFWSIWDIGQHEFVNFETRVFWLVIVVFIPVLGAVAYIIFGRRKKLSL